MGHSLNLSRARTLGPWLILFFICCAIVSNGQGNSIKLNSQIPEAEISDELTEKFADYKLFGPDPSDVLTKVRNGGGIVSIQLDNRSIDLHIHEFDIRSPDYIELENGEKINKVRSACPTFRGHTADENKYEVFATFTETFFTIRIVQDDDELFLEPLKLNGQRLTESKYYVQYYMSDLISEYGTCGTIQEYSDPILNESDRGGGQTCRLVGNVFTDIDNAALGNFSSSTDANNWLLAVMNSVSDLFNGGALRVQLLVSAQNVWTTGSEPWSGQTNASTILNSFNSYWAVQLPFASNNRANQVLMTGIDICGSNCNTIGLAGVGSLCPGGNINEYRSNTNEMMILLAHEIGHNFNAGHCVGNNCGPAPGCNTEQGTIMCGQCCGNTPEFTATAVNVIRGYAENRAESVIGCFGTFTRTLTSSESACMLGNCAGSHTENFIYHTVQTSGPINIGSSYSNLTWRSGDRFILNPGFNASSTSAAQVFSIGINPCTSTPISSSSTAPNEHNVNAVVNPQVSLPVDINIYPNPFRTETIIELNLSQNQEQVSIEIYDLLGLRIEHLVAEKSFTSGIHKITFNSAKHSGSFFFCRVKVGAKEYTKKIVKLQ